MRLNSGWTIVAAILSIYLFTGSGNVHKSLTRKPQNYPFQPGEILQYRMSYSIFTVGRAEVVFDSILYRISGKKYYRIDVNGRTAGAAQLVSSVNDNWGALLDTSSLLPFQSWRNLEEGRYRRRELVEFDHARKRLTVNVIDNKTGRYTDPKVYEIKRTPIRDLVSGYLFLRVIDFRQLTPGDTISLENFLEDTFYHFRIIYEGTEMIETRLGDILAYKLVPVMPDNRIFSGPNSITGWISADNLQIPLRIEAKMFIGHVGCDITGIENTKYVPVFRED